MSPTSGQLGPNSPPRQARRGARRPKNLEKQWFLQGFIEITFCRPRAAQDDPGEPKNGPGQPKRGYKSVQNCPREALEAPSTDQERPKRRPRRPKRGPRGAQDGPRAPRTTTGGPREAPERSRTAQERPRIGQNSSKKASERYRTILLYTIPQAVQKVYRCHERPDAQEDISH